MKVDIITVRLFDDVAVIFEDEFINNNPFETQNKIIEVFSLLYDKDDFKVDYITHYSKDYKLQKGIK